MSKLTSFYQDLIALCGIKVGSYGRLAVPLNEETLYLKYDDKPIVFPEKQYLNATENKPEDIIVFHPLSESSIRGISEVQDVLRRAAIVHLNNIGKNLLDKAIEINRNITADSSFKPDHRISELFAEVGDLDEKFMKFWVKLANKMAEDSKSRLFDIYLKQHGEVDGKRFDRICVISSPLYDQIVINDDNTLFGVKAERKKDINTLSSILTTLFPALESGGYVVGSSASAAPYLNAFIDGLISIETRFNQVLIAFGKEANDTTGLYCSGLEIKHNVDIAKIRNLLPTDKPYNMGAATKKDEAPKPRGSTTVEPKAPVSAAPERREVRQPRDLVESVQVKPRQSQTQTQAPEAEKSGETPFWDRYQDHSRDRYGYDSNYQQQQQRQPQDNRYDARRGNRRQNDRYGSGYGGGYGGYGNQGGYGGNQRYGNDRRRQDNQYDDQPSGSRPYWDR